MMKRYVFFCFVILCICSTVQAQSFDAAGKARAFVQHLTRAEYDSARKDFDSTLTAVLPTNEVENFWKQITGSNGAFVSIDTVIVRRIGVYTAAFVNVTYAHEKNAIQATYNPEGKLAGLYLQHYVPHYEEAMYADTTKFIETPFTFGGYTAADRLTGALTSPKGEGKFPAVILVHGSGPNDMDETIGPNKPFKDIAWGLASNNIAVIRYNKRSFEHPMQMAKKKKLTVDDEVINDVIEVIRYTRTRPNVDPKRIFVLGHSLGAYLAPRIALRDSSLAGIILLAAPTRPLEDIIIEQLHYLKKIDPITYSDEVIKSFDDGRTAIKALTEKDSDRDTLIMGAPPSYWLDLKDYHPVSEVSKLKMHTLVLHGGRDYQVIDANFFEWRNVHMDNPLFSSKSYSNLNHLFMDGTGPSTPQEYQVPAHVTSRVIDDIVKWVHSDNKARK